MNEQSCIGDSGAHVAVTIGAEQNPLYASGRARAEDDAPVGASIGRDPVEVALNAAAAERASVSRENATKRGASPWKEHYDPTSRRPYYANDKGETRWDPPPDLIACPFDGGQWKCFDADGSPGLFGEKTVSFVELWDAAADGLIAENALVGLASIPDQAWLLSYMFSRALVINKVFIAADADHNGTLSLDEFVAWLRAQGGDQISNEVGAQLKDFQELDEDHDGELSHMEFLTFILHHMNSKKSSPHVKALCDWLDGETYLLEKS